MNEPSTERAARERQAYDDGTVWTENDRLHRRFGHVFSGPNSVRAEDLFAARLAEWSRGADVLDYGCWQGHLAGRIVALGARSVTGIDISGESIAVARQVHGDRVDFQVMNGAKMTFPDATFDLVVGRAILHHLDFEQAVCEIHRVLRPGGRALFVEPLLGNPAARLFRTLTPRARTRDERPLSRAQITGADRLFGGAEHGFFGLVSVFVGVASTRLASRPDNWAMRAADRADRRIAATPFRYWMRQAVLAWRKGA
jgi:SAM-dependent methyltransferase